MALAPWFDVGRLNDRVAVRREHSDAAQSAPVFVKRYNCLPEPLIANLTFLLGISRIFPPCPCLCGVAATHQAHTVFIRRQIYLPLLDKRWPNLRGEVCINQDHPVRAMRDVPHISTFMQNHKTFSTSHAKYENVKNVPHCFVVGYNRKT
jgi:hypothetical protein